MADRAFCFSLVLAELIVSVVVISPDDSEGVVLAKVMDLRIAIRPGCFWPGIGLVLAKVMKSAKEIRPDDKKRGAAPAGGRAAACLSGCQRCKEGGPPPGVVVLSVEARAAG